MNENITKIKVTTPLNENSHITPNMHHLLDDNTYNKYVTILKSELVSALGCTEPIAVAFAAAKAVEALGYRPDKIEIWCSGNIIKNVKGVTVPNSNGMKGINAAATLGAIGGDPSRNLEVLQTITSDHIAQAKKLLSQNYCSCHLIGGVENLYIIAKVYAKNHSAEVEIKDKHTNIVKIIRDNNIIYHLDYKSENNQDLMSCLNVRDILEFANTFNISDLQETLDNQINMNTIIAEEGLKNKYGANIGKTILDVYGTDNVAMRAKAKAAAGSDARMDGCSLPVIINSGSGNQGLTVSLPVIEYAKYLKVSSDKMYRALVVSNLIALHQKRYIGRLSAYCGAVSAACGSGAAITYLYGGDYNDIAHTITNTLANVSGIVCDGAKASCAAKIASALDAAILAHHMSSLNRNFSSDDGLVQKDVEKTIQTIGRVGKFGMSSTDIEILNIMIEK